MSNAKKIEKLNTDKKSKPSKASRNYWFDDYGVKLNDTEAGCFITDYCDLSYRDKKRKETLSKSITTLLPKYEGITSSFKANYIKREKKKKKKHIPTEKLVDFTEGTLTIETEGIVITTKYIKKIYKRILKLKPRSKVKIICKENYSVLKLGKNQIGIFKNLKSIQEEQISLNKRKKHKKKRGRSKTLFRSEFNKFDEKRTDTITELKNIHIKNIMNTLIPKNDFTPKGEDDTYHEEEFCNNCGQIITLYNGKAQTICEKCGIKQTSEK